MWQNVIVIVIVALAAAYVIRHLVRSVSGRRSCDCSGCDGCPSAGDCTDKEHGESS